MTQEIMEQIHEDMRQGASEAIDEIAFAQVKIVVQTIIKTSDDPHLLGQIKSLAEQIRETEDELRKNRVKRRAFHPIHNPEGDHTWDRHRGYTGGTDSWQE